MSSDKIIVNIPPMPKPEDFNYDPSAQNPSNDSAMRAYQLALKTWQEAVTGITKAQ